MRIFALGDLHLGLGVGKTMDRFGPPWVGHVETMERNWSQTVSPGDVVLLPGDISWAMSEKEAKPDLQWIDNLPGIKIMIKGNHDYWWPQTRRRVTRLLPSSIKAVDRDSVEIAKNAWVCGTRGWIRAGRSYTGSDVDGEKKGDNPFEQFDNEAILEREIQRLGRSIETLPEDPGRFVIAMLHFPPLMEGESESEFSRLLENARADHCVFGHLHSQEDYTACFEGKRKQTEYHLVSGSYLNFQPKLIAELDCPAVVIEPE